MSKSLKNMNKTELIAKVVELQTNLKEQKDECDAQFNAMSVDLKMEKDMVKSLNQDHAKLNKKLHAAKQNVRRCSKADSVCKNLLENLQDTIDLYKDMSIVNFILNKARIY